MKKNLTFVFLGACLGVSAQVFTGGTGAIGNNGQDTHFPITVSGLPAQTSAASGVQEVCVSITHPDVSELYLFLKSPSGTIVELVGGASVSGADFTGTCFNNTAGASVTKAAPPRTGALKPVGYFGRFNNGQNANGNWTLIVKDWNANANAGNVTSCSLKFGAAPAPVQVSSSNLPLVFINTHNQAIGTNTMMIDLGIVNNGGARNNVSDPRNNYNGKALINIRGSSSKIFEKKSYKIDLRDAAGNEAIANLCGMPAESDWVLSAAYSDKTFMRNALTQHLFRNMGHYSSRSAFVEVFLNNEYIGVYSLMEKPKRGGDRIAIQKMEPEESFPEITGGYILQINRHDDPGFLSLHAGVAATGAKFYYQYEYPRPAVITQGQKNYIKAVLDTFENVMNGTGFADPLTGYRKYIDVTSFVDFLILNELSRNVDGYRLSSYLYKDNFIDGGKIFAGPMWDYDIAWGNANYGTGTSVEWWQYEIPNNDFPSPVWWMKMMKDDPAFRNNVWCRWHTLRKGVLSTASINAQIDQWALHLNESQARNYQQFPILDAYIFPNPAGQIGDNYSVMVNDLKAWVNKRAAWLDQNLPGYCNDVALTELSNHNVQLYTFPNPSKGNFTASFAIQTEARVTIEVSDMMGKLLVKNEKGLLSSGQYDEEIRLDQVPAGTYLLTLNAGERKLHKKIIKLN